MEELWVVVMAESSVELLDTMKVLKKAELKE
jgi:hypothetical protein